MVADSLNLLQKQGSECWQAGKIKDKLQLQKIIRMRINMKQEEVRKGTGQRQRQIQTETNTIQTETNTKDRHARIHS